jgi:hypothetical protein
MLKDHFQGIDFEEFTVHEIVKTKMAVKDTLNYIHTLTKTDEIYLKYASLEGFNEIIRTAYGLMQNPYYNVSNDIKKFKIHLDNISANELSEYQVLEQVNWVMDEKSSNSKQTTLSPDYFLNDYYRFNELKEAYNEALKLYDEALQDKTNIMRKALHIPKSYDIILNNNTYNYNRGGHYSTWNHYYLSSCGKHMHVDMYSWSDDSWEIGKSRQIVETVEDINRYNISKNGKELFKHLFPERVI